MGVMNGTEPVIDFTEGARAAGIDHRTLRKWCKDHHPDLGVMVSGRLYVRRRILEKILGSPLENDVAPRVTVVAPNGVLFRVAPHVAHKYVRMGAKVAEDDELSQKNYDAWLEQQRAAEVTS